MGLSTDTDSELIAQILAQSLARKKKTARKIEEDGMTDEIVWLMEEELELSYSLLIMTCGRIYALRDTFGNRPLCLGSMNDGS